MGAERGGGVRDFPVSPQRLGVDEGFGTEPTRVRSLAGVLQAVAFEAGRIFVRFSTISAVIGPEMEIEALGSNIVVSWLKVYHLATFIHSCTINC